MYCITKLFYVQQIARERIIESDSLFRVALAKTQAKSQRQKKKPF
jgi:hypothetical protein